MYKFRDVNASKTENVTKRTQLQAEFTSYVNVSSAVPTIVFLIINTLVTQWYELSSYYKSQIYTFFFTYNFNKFLFRISVHKRMLGSLILMLILFIVTTICVNINTDQCKTISVLKILSVNNITCRAAAVSCSNTLYRCLT